MHCKENLGHSLPKCSLSDESDRYRTHFAHFVLIVQGRPLQTMDSQRTWIEIFLADFQAVITFFHWVLGNLNGVPPSLHHRNGDTRLPRQT
jgi:hypothetical protein